MKKTIYSGKIRDGKPGTLSKDTFNVIFDTDLQYACLDPFPFVNYESAEYRDLVNDSSKVDDYFRLHDGQQPGYFNFIAPVLKRGDVVADCGCGGGSMLDLVKGIAKETIAIEPFQGYHTSLKERGHQPFASITEAAKATGGKVDLGLSIHVIEHTEDPVSYLREIHSLLNEKGKLILFTPNLDDIFLKLIPAEYEPFFFHTVHNYYFSGNSLKIMAEKAGFAKTTIFYYHEFTFGNAIAWLRDKTAKGNIGFDCLGDHFDLEWRDFLEKSGQAYSVGAILEKA